ncbi:hypothetical protein FSP39_022140 [Pinctada imbricata]|uniref:B box-type domain-containing protein n=1 Tax=Pinctada imbricata TaxID=66713 RepID=A0AA89C7C0_PINIB|nr:hypothetical protein FSP39_022140 [Pinctada imbricata]
MCSNSREYHLKSRASSDHNVVLFYDKAESLIKSLSHCKDHPSQKYQLWCEPCETAVCIKCTTNNHYTHRFLELNTIYDTKRKAIIDSLHDLRNEVLPKWNKRQVEVGNSILEYQRNVQNLDKELIQEGEKLKSRIDESVTARRKELQQKCSLVVRNLSIEEQSCRKEILNVREVIAEFEDRLRHEDQMTTIHFDLSRTKYQEVAHLPELPKQNLPRLIGGDLEKEDFEKIFRNLAISESELWKETTGTKKPLFQQELYQRVPSPAQLARPTQKFTQDPDLLIEHVLVSKVKTTAQSPSVGCLSSRRAWMETKPNVTSMVDIQGNILHSVSMPPSSFTISRSEHIVAISYDEKMVTEITKADERRPLFALPYRPTGICSTPENVVVAFHEAHETVVYDWNGESVTKYTSVRYPYKVTVNKVTKDICISSKPDLSVPGCIGIVVALRKSGGTHFEYKGSDPDHFSPVELCSDPGGRVLVADCGSNNVHIIDRDGGFLTYLLIHQETFHIPMTIDCDREGQVWVGEMDGTMKIVKYLNM